MVGGEVMESALMLAGGYSIELLNHLIELEQRFCLQDLQDNMSNPGWAIYHY